MKIFLTTIISVLISVSAYSQISEFSQITTSNIFLSEKTCNIKGFFELNNGETITIRDDGEFIEIIRYDEDFNQYSKSNPIKFTYKQDYAKNFFKQVHLTKEDKAIIIFEQKFRKQKKIIIWANILNIENEELELSEPIKLTEIFYKDQIKDYHISFNNEMSKFVFVNYIKIKKPKKHNILSYKVYNTDFEKIWEHKLDDISVYSSPAGMFRIADNGKVVTVIPVKDKTVKKIDKSQQKALFYVYIYDSEGSLEKNMTLKMKENTFLTDFNITIGSNNKLRAAGTYTDNIKNVFSTGTINFSVNLNEVEEPEYKMNKFTMDVITSYIAPKSIKKYIKAKEKGKSLGINYLSVGKIISHEDGYYSIMEKKWQVKDKKTSIVSYYNYDYVVSSFSNDDELLWIKKVPKSLRAVENNFYSDDYFMKNENLYFIHFDAEENFINFTDVKNGYRDYFPDHLVVQKLNIDGELDRELAFKMKNLGFDQNWVPYHYIAENTINATTFLFYTKKNAAFLKVEIDD